VTGQELFEYYDISYIGEYQFVLFEHIYCNAKSY